MDDYLDGFSDYLRVQKFLSENTLQSYRTDIRQFLAYQEEHSSLRLSDLTEGELERYVDALREKGRSSATLSRFVASMRAFYQYLNAEGIAQGNPAAELHVERKPRCAPEVLTGSEVERLFSQPVCADFKGCRDKAMLELLYATGIRVSELMGLNIRDVDLVRGLLLCRDTERQRVIPIYPEALGTLSLYLEKMSHIRNLGDRDGAMFVNVSGHRLSRQGFWKIVREYAAQAGIQKHITPHTLRHSFAAHLMENGADDRSVQKMMGYADIASTQIYEQFRRDNCRSVYNRCHPKA